MTVFRVGLRTGGHAVGWPFGTVTIDGNGIAIQSLRGRWIQRRYVARSDVGAVTVDARWGLKTLIVASTDDSFNCVRVELPWRPRRVLTALDEHGYVVVDSA